MHWFKNLNAKPRIMLSFGLILALIAGIAGIAIVSLESANRRVQSIAENDMAGLAFIDNLLLADSAMGKSNRDAILNMRDAVKVAAAEKSTQASLAEVHTNLDEADKHFYSVQGIAYLATLRKALPDYEAANANLMQQVHARNKSGVKAALAAFAATGKVLTDAGDGARKNKTAMAAAKVLLDTQQNRASRTVILLTAAVSMALGVFLSLILARGFSVPLQQAVVALEHLAAGDLTATLDVHTEDEMGRMAAALNAALARLRITIQSVCETASTANTSSNVLANAAQAIANGSQEQAASLEQTCASLEEIAATVRLSADNAKQANQLALSSTQSAQQGQAIVVQAIAAMIEINAASAKISDITSTVNEIAFLTNLLAVNAAVEAARAGEQGRGFAVVATEVRSLAVRSAASAREIKDLIQDSLNKVARGTDLVNQSGETLNAIVGSVRRVTGIVGEISAATQEQIAAFDQVNRAVNLIDQVTQSNSAQTEELSATAEELSEQSQRLSKLISIFKLTCGQPSSSPSPTRPNPTRPAPQPQLVLPKAARRSTPLRIAG